MCGLRDQCRLAYVSFFFLNDPAPPEIYPLSLHDALPINDTATTEIYTLSLHDAFRSRWSPYHLTSLSFCHITSAWPPSGPLCQVMLSTMRNAFVPEGAARLPKFASSPAEPCANCTHSVLP